MILIVYLQGCGVGSNNITDSGHEMLPIPAPNSSKFLLRIRFSTPKKKCPAPDSDSSKNVPTPSPDPHSAALGISNQYTPGSPIARHFYVSKLI